MSTVRLAGITKHFGSTVAVDFFECRPRHARRDALDVSEHRPRLLDRHRHREFVGQLHGWDTVVVMMIGER